MTRLRAWWRKWKPWTADYEGRAFWIGVGSVMDLTGEGTRRNLEQLRRDRRQDRGNWWTECLCAECRARRREGGL